MHDGLFVGIELPSCQRASEWGAFYLNGDGVAKCLQMYGHTVILCRDEEGV